MSSLTGEPRPIAMRVLPEETESVVHAHNIGFSSSLVITGEGVGVVTRCVAWDRVGAHGWGPAVAVSEAEVLDCLPFSGGFAFASRGCFSTLLFVPFAEPRTRL